MRSSARTGLEFSKLRNSLQTAGVARGQVYTLANTAVAQFDNASMFEFAKQAGTKYYEYSGMLNPNTRDFCRKHLGKIYSEEEILKMDNGQGLSVMSACGGYNCTHYWLPVADGARGKRVEGKGKTGGLEFGSKIKDVDKKALSKYTSKDYIKMISDIRNDKNISYNKKDLKQDLTKHANEMGLNEKEYVGRAVGITKTSNKILAHIFKGKLQLDFFGKDGVVVVDEQHQIRGFFESNDITKTFKAYAERKLWIKQ